MLTITFLWNTKAQRHEELTKTGGKPLFCKAAVHFARQCLQLFFRFLQTSLHLP